MQPRDVGRVANRMRDRRAFAFDEVELETHRSERQQQIGEENRRVDLDHVDGLERDRDGEIGVAADVEQRIALAQRTILGHVAPGLAHEPDGGGVDGLFRQARRKRSFTPKPGSSPASSDLRATSA